MNEQEWLIQFDADKGKFEWFFIKYGFDIEWRRLNDARAKNQVGRMKCLMNDVFLVLPDDEFNIRMKPDGWNEFLALITD